MACESPLRWGLIVLLGLAADAETLCEARQANRIEATRPDLASSTSNYICRSFGQAPTGNDTEFVTANWARLLGLPHCRVPPTGSSTLPPSAIAGALGLQGGSTVE